VHEGQAVTEVARAIKSADEIKAMRCALATCEAAMQVMQEQLRPGVTEQELWAHLHAENVRRGGEWIETRLLASGPRTNPWFQECGSRPIAAGDLVAFDTDLIGPYGYCADISRTWRCGEGRASRAQVDLYHLAREQIACNLELVRPGLGLRELSAKAFQLPERYRANRYSTIAHGVGLCDEYPAIYYPEDAQASGYDGVLEAGMTICIESYVGEAGGAEGVKLEEQLLVTETGCEVLSRYPFEDDVFR
jgi:Xaa-Pro aminopeptidase